MKAGTHKIEVEAQLILNRRELQLLNHIFSYDHSSIVKGVVSSYYSGGVTEEEVKTFMKSIRAETSVLISEIEDAKKVLFKNG